MTLTKRELVIRVANELAMSQSDVSRVLEGMLDAVCQTLAQGQRLEFRGFGVFEAKTRAARIGRNPHTGEQVSVPQRRVVTYRAGKKLAGLLSAPTPAQDQEQERSEEEAARPS